MLTTSENRHNSFGGFREARFIPFSQSLSIMKAIFLGEQFGTYDDIILQEAKKANKFGKMFYLKDRIYLVQRKPSTDYNIWTSDKGEKHLRLKLTDDLKNELEKIEKAAISKNSSFVFKSHEDGNIFVKFFKDCPTALELNGELQYTLQIYGFFTQNSTGNTFLQMDILEQQTTKVSFLNRGATGLNYEPNSKAWEDSLKF